MRKPSESYAKELLGLGVTVPVSLLATSTLPPRGRMTMSRECRSVSAVISQETGPLSQVWALARACSTL